MDPHKISTVEGIRVYTFVDRGLVWAALQGNKKQAMIGDTVLRLVILEDMMQTVTTKGTLHNPPTILIPTP